MLISAFAFGGIPERAIKKAFTEAEVFVSPEILKEYRDVSLRLGSEGKINFEQTKTLISGIASFVTKAKIVYPEKRLFICRDAEDNILLECCFSSHAKFLVTGDADLLEIKNLPFDLKILSPSGFIKEE